MTETIEQPEYWNQLKWVYENLSNDILTFAYSGDYPIESAHEIIAELAKYYDPCLPCFIRQFDIKSRPYCMEDDLEINERYNSIIETLYTTKPTDNDYRFSYLLLICYQLTSCFDPIFTNDEQMYEYYKEHNIEYKPRSK